MKKFVSMALMVGTMAFASVAVAGQCPLLWKQIDDALPKVTDAKKAADAKKLRGECEQLHKDGKHADSVAKCVEAGKVAGIELKMKN
jgi:hypothetical protein